MFIEALLFSASVTLPTILMLLLGIALRRKKMIDDHFCEMASKLVFNIALPALLFVNVVKEPTDYASLIWLVGAGVIGTLIIYFGGELLALRFIDDRAYRGIFVQGLFRANSGILGLALCINAYGSPAVAPASVYTACITLLFNVLAVITLTNSLSDGKLSVIKIIKSILKNPLIIAIVFGIILSKLEVAIPKTVIRTGDYLANIALPLALICAGASLNFKQLKLLKQSDKKALKISRIVIVASIGRLLIAPLLMVILGKFVFDLPAMSIGILFLISSTPVAAASYAMVRHFGGDATASANLIALTNLGSMFTTSLGIVILKQLGWM